MRSNLTAATAGRRPVHKVAHTHGGTRGCVTRFISAQRGVFSASETKNPYDYYKIYFPIRMQHDHDGSMDQNIQHRQHMQTPC